MRRANQWSISPYYFISLFYYFFPYTNFGLYKNG
jgi:hypothetical protein